VGCGVVRGGQLNRAQKNTPLDFLSCNITPVLFGTTMVAEDVPSPIRTEADALERRVQA